MAHALELAEHSSATVRLTHEQARRLAAAAAGALGVALSQAADHFVVSSTSLVGTIVFDDLKVLIRPKIRPDNLFLLLDVGLPSTSWRREAFDYATTGDLLPSMVAFFARTAETTLARGVLRSYQEEEDRLVAIRGRIDMKDQFRRAGLQIPTACRFDEYTTDVAENRYLKLATRRALRLPGVLPEDRRRLLHQLVALEEVSDVSGRAEDLERIVLTRLNEHYVPALRLAQVILRNATLVDQGGATGASSFLVDMNQIFEDFVTSRLRRALQGRLEVLPQFSTHLAEGNQVSIRPDLVFRRKGVVKYVGDVKYKLTADARARTGDYYQLHAYTTALSLGEGVLIYCQADGGVPARSVRVRHAGKVLHTRAVNLSGPPESVGRSIHELADWIVSRS